MNIKNSLFSLYCEKKRKRSEFASLRIAFWHRAFASLSLFKRSNSQKSENFRLILAIIFQKKAFLGGWNLSFFRYFRENYGKNNQDREGGLLSVRNQFGQTNFFTNGADFFLDTIKIELGGSSMNFCALFWRIILIRK